MTRGFKKIITELLKQDRKFFTLNQIVKDTGLKREAVRDVLIELCIDDYLKRIRRVIEPYSKQKGPALQNVTYRIRRPRDLIKRITPKYRSENNAGDRIWFIIRGLRKFTRRDLRVLTCDMKGQPTMSKETVRWYTKMLHRAGIIRQGARGEWALIKDVGPRRPYVGDQVNKMRISDCGLRNKK
jgi:DNA-binding Lrp family transcriptional regulator